MKLYLIHCGYYDLDIADGLYENHVNYFVAAENFNEAKVKAKSISEYKNKKMHIDGIQEIQMVNGHLIKLEYQEKEHDFTKIINFKHRELSVDQIGKGVS